MNLPSLPADQQVANKEGRLMDGYWMFLSGISKWLRRYPDPVMIQQSTQADLAALASKLTKEDAGLLVEVTDFAHVLRWNGSGWEWGPGEEGGGYLRLFEVDPTGAGWRLYDGSVVDYLKSDGTTGSVTLPDLTTGEYLKTGAANSGPHAAVAPTMSGGAISAASTGISTATGLPSSTTNVLQGTGSAVTVASAFHSHAVTITDPQHTHSISSITAGTNGEPANVVRRPFFRQ